MGERDDRLRDLLGNARVEQDGGVSGYFRQRRDVAAGDRHAGRHGLDDRQAKAFIQRRKDHAGAVRYQSQKLGVGEIARKQDVVSQAEARAPTA